VANPLFFTGAGLRASRTALGYFSSRSTAKFSGLDNEGLDRFSDLDARGSGSTRVARERRSHRGSIELNTARDHVKVLADLY